MSSCIPAREVVLRFRSRGGNRVHTEHLICPGKWGKQQVLDYCRAEHPNETVVIEEWMGIAVEGHPWRERLWLVNPKEMVNT
jgi:hypothetical protein